MSKTQILDTLVFEATKEHVNPRLNNPAIERVYFDIHVNIRRALDRNIMYGAIMSELEEELYNSGFWNIKFTL
jgi:hypothetical protein